MTSALIETAIGLCHIAIGIVLHIISFALQGLAWLIRTTRGIWRAARL